MALSAFWSGAALGAQSDELASYYGVTRWNEDYSYLAENHEPLDWLDSVKYLPLSSDTYPFVTLGGQFREVFIQADTPAFGSKQVSTSYDLQRLFLFADMRFSPAFRGFFELGDERAFHKARPLAVSDQDRVDAQLAFIDYTGTVGNQTVTGRVGRQEIVFDPVERFLALREGPNVRQAFDGVLLTSSSADFRATAFATAPVLYHDASNFDDESDPHSRFSGARMQLPGMLSGWLVPAVYYYRYSADSSKIGLLTGSEGRDSFGSRLSGTVGALDWDFEPVWQTGHFAGRSIRAWAVGSIVGYTFAALPWHPRIALQSDVASGAERTSRDASTFNPLFPNGSYFSQAGLTGFSNLRHEKLSLLLHPSRDLTVLAAGARVAKQSPSDFAYAQPLIPIPSTLGLAGHVANYEQAKATYTLNNHLSFDVELVDYQPDYRLRALGSHDIHFSRIQANFQF